MKAKKTTLPNGLRVITVPMADTPTVTVLVLVSAGSKYETKEINGLSHFLEHMCFKGTMKRPMGSQISIELDGLGSKYNAFTSTEYTGYYAKAAAKHFDALLDIISDTYQNPVFDSKEIEKEKGVIIDEINMYDDMPNRHVHDLFGKVLYGDEQFGAWNVLGSRENIRRMTREDFIAYRKNNYVASGTVVVVAGNINEAEALKKIKERFSTISIEKKQDKDKVRESQDKPSLLLEYKETDQTHIVMGFRAFPIFDKRRSILSVLSGILGSGMSSRLFRKIRDEMGVGYYIDAAADLYTDHGTVAMWTGVANARAKEVIQAVLGEWKLLSEEKVPADELKKVKEHLIGHLYLGLESSDDVASFYGGQEILMGELETPEEKAAKISAVTAEELQSLAKELFKNETLNMAMIGPFKDKGEFAEVLRLS